MDSSIKNNFLSKKRFGFMIEEAVLEKNISYMDAIIYLCEENMIDLEEVKKYISPVIENKLLVEAQKLNFIEGETYDVFS